MILRKDVLPWGNRVDRALAAGRIERILPGAYCSPGAADLGLRARAVMALDPSAVITGRAAAALWWWPELITPVLEVASTGRHTSSASIQWHQGRVPPELTVEAHGLRMTAPALTVLDLVGSLGGQPIDQALRRRAVTLPQLWDALAATPGRPGNVQRRLLLHDSRDEPWSEAERVFHRVYRRQRLGHRHATNLRVVLADGSARFLDFALPDLLLGFEVDGFRFHGSREAFRRDRVSDAQLAALGWHRVRFDAADLFDDEEGVARTIRGVVRAREALLGRHPPARLGRGRAL